MWFYALESYIYLQAIILWVFYWSPQGEHWEPIDYEMNSVNKIWGNNCCMAAYKDWVKNLSIPNFELHWKYLKLQSQLNAVLKSGE